jgi:hypothetical protein
MLTRRNGIESINALVKWRGLAGRQQNRARKARDKRVEWIVGLGLLYITARRLAHERGDYQTVLDEMELLGYLNSVSPDNPAPGPDPATYWKVRSQRYADGVEMHPPRSTAWPFTRYYTHGGMKVQWARPDYD